jgi:hypothetical protein
MGLIPQLGLLEFESVDCLNPAQFTLARLPNGMLSAETAINLSRVLIQIDGI